MGQKVHVISEKEFFKGLRLKRWYSEAPRPKVEACGKQAGQNKKALHLNR
jgi:hypothetical protein